MTIITFTADLRALKACAVAIHSDPVHYYLMGVNVGHTSAGLTCVATDGARMIVAQHDWRDATGAPPAFEPFTIPAELLKRIKLPARPTTTDVTVTLDYRNGDCTPHVKLAYDGAAVTSDAIDGPFPNWRAVLPREEASGEAAHYNVSYLESFRDAVKALHGKTNMLPFVAQNGAGKPAIVDLRTDEVNLPVRAFGVIMPVRNKRDAPLRATPSWAHAQATPATATKV